MMSDYELELNTIYSVDSIKRTIHLAFHGLFSLLKILFSNSKQFSLATVLLIEQYS